jgi:hypothetical protein
MSQVPPLSCVLPLLFAIGLSGACGPPDLGPAVAIPTLELNRAQVPLGGPIEMTYGFTPSPEIRTLTEPYRVSVHFLDADGELMFTDDHDPAVPTTDWYPGQLVTYDRRLFIPVYPYVGDASIALGLYSPATGRRFALAGEHIGDAGHAVVATIELTPPPEGIFLEFREGWHQREFDDDQEWQWSAGDGIVAFGNPRQDSILYLELDGRSDLFDAPQRVDLVVGDRTVDSFVVEASDVTFHTATLSAADFGDDDTIELTLHVDQTFVPAELPDAGNADTRRLGVRVFNLFLERR